MGEKTQSYWDRNWHKDKGGGGDWRAQKKTSSTNSTCKWASLNRFQARVSNGRARRKAPDVPTEMLIRLGLSQRPEVVSVRRRMRNVVHQVRKVVDFRFFCSLRALIKLALPQAAQLSLNFCWNLKISGVAPQRGTCLTTHHWLLEIEKRRVE